MRKLLSHILAAVLGLWLATLFIPGIHIGLQNDSSFFGIRLTHVAQVYVLLGIILGLLNFFVKPILDIITLPLRIITLGLFGFVVQMALLWAVDVMFIELNAPLFWPLFWTSLAISLLYFVIGKALINKD